MSGDIATDVVNSLRGYVAAIWPSYITRYFTVPVQGYPKLRAAVWYGFMESGKTYSDAVLQGKLVEKTHARLYVVTNNVVYALWELINRADELRSYNYLDILFDDALVLAHSLEKRSVKVYTDKTLSVVRHVVSRGLGRQQLVITLRIATQKFTILNPVLRNSPVIFLKSAPNDPGDVSAITRLVKHVSGKKVVMQLLRDLTAASYVDDAFKRYTVAVVAGRAKLVLLDGVPAKPDIEIRHAKINVDEFEEVASRLLDML